jgi:hypothetical protein
MVRDKQIVMSYRLAGRLAVLSALAILAGCRADVTQTDFHSADYRQCQAMLTTDRVAFDPLADISGAGECGVRDGVRLNSMPEPLSQPAIVTCQMAAALARYDAETLQPLAQQFFHKKLARIDHAGAYACRAIRTEKGHLSEHAFGRAIDLTGFELADGTRITVANDWFGGGPKQQFLRAAAKAACSSFGAVLTPSYNLDHFDHIHIDLGRWKLCGAG